MTEARRLLGLVQHYERLLSDMQSGTFFAQDEEGLLRRWYPPRAITANGKHVISGEGRTNAG